MRKKSMKEAEAAIEETVKKWDPAKDPHIEVRTTVSLRLGSCTHLYLNTPPSLQDALNAVACLLRPPCCNTCTLHRCRETPSRRCSWGGSATMSRRRSCGGSSRSMGPSKASPSCTTSNQVPLLLSSTSIPLLLLNAAIRAMLLQQQSQQLLCQSSANPAVVSSPRLTTALWGIVGRPCLCCPHFWRWPLLLLLLLPSRLSPHACTMRDAQVHRASGAQTPHR